MRVVDRCHSCDSPDLRPVFNAGYLPLVNDLTLIGAPQRERQMYPAQLLRCEKCTLIQLGFVVDREIVFPPEYPYTSGTTKQLRDNFANLAVEASAIAGLKRDDLVVDIGSNDGTLLTGFAEVGKVLGVEPTDQAKRSPWDTIQAFFDRKTASEIVHAHGKAKIITAANVFAHIDDIHEVIEGVCDLLADDGVFVVECHDWNSMLSGLQFDCVYHEHLRHYTPWSLTKLLSPHGLFVNKVVRILTHGGSFRLYASRSNTGLTDMESGRLMTNFQDWDKLQGRATDSKFNIMTLLMNAASPICGIGAPSRATTMIHYLGLDEGIIETICEISGSQKIGKYMPGTMIPVVDEARLYEEQPPYVFLFSWHIADELIPLIRSKGYRGKFIVPLPTPRIV